MTMQVSGTSGFTFPDNTTQATAAKAGMVNRIINGAMMIDQRNAGASVTPTDGQYLVDRWVSTLTAASKFTAQQSSTAPAGFTASQLITSSSSYSIASGDIFGISQKIEGFNFSDMAWGTASAQPVTLSFKVRSSLTGTFGGSFTNSANNRSYPFTFTINSANTFEDKTITVAGDTTGTWVGGTNGVGVRVWFGLGVGSTYSGTAGAWAGSAYFSATGATSVVGTNGATFYITGVQLEKGSTATSFDYRPYGTELALCQRYYQTAGAAASGSFDSSTTVIQFSEKLSVPMRTVPTASVASGGYASFRSTGTDFNNSAPALANFTANTSTSFWCQVTGFVGGTAQAVATGRNLNAGNNFVALSAEL